MIEYKLRNLDGTVKVTIITDGINIDYGGSQTVMDVIDITDSNISLGISLRALDIIDEGLVIALADDLSLSLEKLCDNERLFVSGYSVLEFTIVDDSDAPVADAIINFGGYSYNTDADGKATVYAINGASQRIEIVASGLFTEVNTLTVSGNNSVDVTMSSKREVTFTVLDDDVEPSPVAGAVITLIGVSGITDENGVAVLVSSDGEKAYTVVKSGFINATGTVIVDGDVSEEVTMIEGRTVQFIVKDDASFPAPVEGATVTFDGEEGITNENGIAMMDTTSGENREYIVSKEGYETAEGTVTVDSDEIQPVTIKEYYDVEFTVVNDDDVPAPVEGAFVVFEGETKSTDVSGKATFQTIKGVDLAYTITKADHEDCVDTVTVDEDETVNETLKVLYDVEFTVVNDDDSPAPVENATISFAGETVNTNASGKATIQSVKGTDLPYTITMADHEDGDGTITVDGNETVNETLKVLYDVAFTVTADGTGLPIEGATVTFAGDTENTNSEGKATIQSVKGVDLAYTVEADTYTTVNDIVTVDGDEAEAVTMTLS